MFDGRETWMIRHLNEKGYHRKDAARIMDVKKADIIRRVVDQVNRGDMMDASSVLSIYPLLVEKTCRSDLPFEEQLKNAVMGLCGEAGEVIDIVKKSAFQGHELNTHHMIEELGDVLYYLTWLCILLDADLSEVSFENMKKLTARYPNGFDPDRSIHREGGNGE